MTQPKQSPEFPGRFSLAGRKVGDSEYVAFRDVYQVVPDGEYHSVFLAKNDISVGVPDRVASRVSEGLNDGAVFGGG